MMQFQAPKNQTKGDPVTTPALSFSTCARLGVAGLLALCSTAAFAQWNFSSCAATGATGPTQAACDTAYGSTNLAGAVTVAGGIQSWTVPTTGTYRITAVGGQGAAGEPTHVGGRGAELSGDFTLSAGTTLRIAVGQQGLGQGSGGNGGTEGNGGGGGGSFVVGSADSAMLVAGGGGGTRVQAAQDGCNASLTEYGIEGSGSQVTSACTPHTAGLRQGGLVSSTSYGSAGAGFDANGQDDPGFGTGGKSWLNGLGGGAKTGGSCNDAPGGFGGGGAGNGCAGGGGGGGYSGGDGGLIGGGGGSYNGGAKPAAVVSTASGDGRVVIALVSAAAVAPVPTASSVGLIGLALLLGVAGMRRARSARNG